MKLSRALPAVVLTFAAACSGAATLSVEDVVARIQEAQEKVRATHMTADVSVSMPSMTEPVTMTMEQWVQGEKMRVEYTEGPAGMDGTVMVMADGTVTMYTPSTNSYLEMEMPDATAAAASPEQAAAMTAAWVKRLIDTMTVELAGVEEVAGRRTYRLEATPKATASAEGASTLWVDAETFYPLKMDLAMGSMRMQMTVREIEYDPELPAETFVFTPPEGAQAMDTGDFQMPAISTTTAEEAAEKVDFPLLAPSGEAGGFELTNTQTVDVPMPTGGQSAIVSQTYAGPGGQIVVQQMPAMGDLEDMAAAMGAGGNAREVKVGDHDATLVTLGITGSMLTWETGQTRVTLNSVVSEDVLLAFAASMR